ncbi:putative serine/threonine-protein kinase PBL3 isoform X1 [Salvia divinorum]|uniref:Serine/threonine-protein kinase PBL3 isoform X1 n=1 Tax=Salvia divinorum TaxID=28513 RepID=A0ABD1GL50_SALDI
MPKLSNYCYGTDDPTSEMTCIPTSQVLVSPGYTALEYISKGHLTTKSNAYTFGVVLLELLFGTIIDIRLGSQYSHDAAYKVVKLALKCLDLDPKSRPRMSDVVVALEQFQGHEPM